MVVATTGFFDGVHTGHRIVIDKLCEVARERGAESTVVTFWPHPRNVLRQDAKYLRLLTSLEEKTALLKECGVDHIHTVKFTKEFSQLSCEEFLRDYLVGSLGVSALVIGYDHRVGNPAYSTDIEAAARKLGLETIRVPARSDSYNTISSTYIRNLISTGGIVRANQLLGYDYRMKGVVVSGNGLGRQIGFPTANMELYEPLKMIPEEGVYAVKVTVEGESHTGVCNIGRRPTIGDNRGLVIETHILDFNEDIYGLDLALEFRDKLRDEQKFGSIDSLRAQLAIDAEQTKAIFG